MPLLGNWKCADPHDNASYLYSVLLEANCASLSCLTHPTIVLGTGHYHSPHCVCRSCIAAGRLRTYPRSPCVSCSASQPALFHPRVLPALFDSNATCFTAHLQALVTYAFPSICYIFHSPPNTFPMWQLLHQSLQAGGFERKATTFHEYNYLCAQIIVHIIG